MRASAAVGRVGGLAVALGIGAAVTVGCAGAAWADSTDPSSSATAPAVHRATVSSHSRRPAAAPERMASQSVSTATPAPAAARRQAARVAGATAKTTAAANNANSFASTFFNQTPTLSLAGNPVQGANGVVTGMLNGTDAEGDPLTYSVTAAPSNGTVAVGTNGSYTYTPSESVAYAGTIDSFAVTASTDTFTVTVTDGYGGSTPVAVSVPIRAATASNARVTYVFSYTTGAQYWTADAKSALQSAADKIASYIVVSQPVTLTFEVTASNAPNSSNLASAGSDLGGVGSGYSYTVVQGKLLGGQDANGSQYDGSIDANFGQPWAFGNTVGSSQYDFVSTMMHEMLHAYGFLSYLDQAGYNTGRQWPVFDNAVSDQNGTLVINGSYRFNTAFNPNLTGGNGGLYFSGAHAVAAYGGLVPLYTPNPWEAGSSLSHLDDNTFTGANAQLMNAYADSGPGIRVLSPVEKGILQDLGYTLSPASIVVVGFFIRRRKVKT